MHNMNLSLNFYSVASSAARGAKRANVATPIIFRMISGDNEGKFSFVNAETITDVELFDLLPSTDMETVSPDFIANAKARVEAEAARVLAAAAAKATPAKTTQVNLPKPGEVVIPVASRSSYKELARRSPAKSTVSNPVDIVWAFVAQNPDMPRKQAIIALVEMGINLATVKTQYQKAKSGKARFKKAAE
jgi:hypothetical protein